MKLSLKIEEAALTIVAIYLLSFHRLGLPGWAWALIFFSPDISMLGYLPGNKIGAFTYNLFHHKAVAIALACTGFFLHNELFLSIGILLFAHASFDRIWGYGFKYVTGFKHTHLGSLEKPAAISYKSGS